MPAWKRLTDDLNIRIPDEHLREITPGLEALFEAVRQALDQDLSTIDPAVIFRPDGE